MGWSRSQFPICGDARHAPHRGTHDRRPGSEDNCFGWSTGGPAELTLPHCHRVASISNPGLFRGSADKSSDAWVRRKLRSNRRNHMGSGTCRSGICRTGDFVGRNRELRCNGCRCASGHLARDQARLCLDWDRSVGDMAAGLCACVTLGARADSARSATAISSAVPQSLIARAGTCVRHGGVRCDRVFYYALLRQPPLDRPCTRPCYVRRLFRRHSSVIR